MSQPPAKENTPTQSQKQIKIVDVTVEKCGKLAEDSKFENIREELDKELKAAVKGKQDPAGPQRDQDSTTQVSPNEAVFFKDDVFEIIADFKAIPPEEVYCRVSEGCVEIGAIHKETIGTGANARHLDLQLTRLYQTPRAIHISDVHCYLSSDGVLLVTGPYKASSSSKQQGQQSGSK